MAVGNVLTAYGDLPKGRYYIRVRAANGVGTSPDSNQIVLRIGKQLATPNGLKVTWVGYDRHGELDRPRRRDAPRMCRPTSSSKPAVRPASATWPPFNPADTTVFSADVTSGTYYVRVHATNDHGESDPTADLMLVAPGAPNAPTAFMASGSWQQRGPALDGAPRRLPLRPRT